MPGIIVIINYMAKVKMVREWFIVLDFFQLAHCPSHASSSTLAVPPLQLDHHKSLLFSPHNGVLSGRKFHRAPHPFHHVESLYHQPPLIQSVF